MDPSGKPYTTLHAYTAARLEYLRLATSERTLGVVIEMFNMRSLRAAGGTSMSLCGFVTFNAAPVPLVPSNRVIHIQTHPFPSSAYLQGYALRRMASSNSAPAARM